MPGNHDNKSSRKSSISCFSVFFGPGSSVGSGGASTRPPKRNQSQLCMLLSVSGSYLFSDSVRIGP